MNLTKIAESWYDFSTADEYTKQLMAFRLRICDACPEKVQMSKVGQILVQFINEEASLYKCNKCQCPLAAKTAGAENTCPLGKWGMAGSETI